MIRFLIYETWLKRYLLFCRLFGHSWQCYFHTRRTPFLPLSWFITWLNGAGGSAERQKPSTEAHQLDGVPPFSIHLDMFISSTDSSIPQTPPQPPSFVNHSHLVFYDSSHYHITPLHLNLSLNDSSHPCPLSLSVQCMWPPICSFFYPTVYLHGIGGSHGWGLCHVELTEHSDWLFSQEAATLRQRHNALRAHPFFVMDIVLKEGKDLVVRDSCGESSVSVQGCRQMTEIPPHLKWSIRASQKLAACINCWEMAVPNWSFLIAFTESAHVYYSEQPTRQQTEPRQPWS